MSDKPELLPCPLCGCADNEAMCWDGIWSVVHSDNSHHVEVTAPTRDDAILAWNTRTPDPVLTHERDQLTGCAIAARSYAEGVEYGKATGYGDEFKAVLTCRQSLDSEIANAKELRERLEAAEAKVSLAFDVIAKANTVTILSLGEMESIVNRALAGEFDAQGGKG